jgi:excisionase family DNA binding protein
VTRDVYKAIETQIRSGELPPGTRLPSVSTVSELLGVPYSHVRTAFSQLAARDLIRASGPGYQVSRRAVPAGPPPSPDSPTGRVLLTVYEIAAIMRVSKMTVYRLIHTGELESIRVGRSFRVPEDSFRAYLEAQTCG